jgi:hypothetical protein
VVAAGVRVHEHEALDERVRHDRDVLGLLRLLRGLEREVVASAHVHHRLLRGAVYHDGVEGVPRPVAPDHLGHLGERHVLPLPRLGEPEVMVVLVPAGEREGAVVLVAEIHPKGPSILPVLEGGELGEGVPRGVVLVAESRTVGDPDPEVVLLL